MWVVKMKKRLISLFMVLIIISLISIPDIVEAKSKGYLVLVRNDPDSKWTAYEGLVCKSPEGNIMVKAAPISKLLKLDYSTTKNGFKITDNRNSLKENLTFIKGSNEYSFYDGKKSVKKKAVFKAYNSKDFTPSSNVIHFASLKDLEINATYFSKSDMPEKYKSLGYSGIVCFGGFYLDSIEELPSLYRVVDTKGNPLVELEPVKYDGYVAINGIDIPRLTGFAEENLSNNYWGADNYKEGEESLINALHDYSDKLKEDIKKMKISDNSGDLTQLAVKNQSISAEITGGSANACLILSKNLEQNCYDIYISSRLSKNPNKNQTDYSLILQNILKLYCHVISNNGDDLYELIYNHAELDSSLINKTSWTTIGSCQVKYSVIKGQALIYHIRAK
jgi:hypothetical protein